MPRKATDRGRGRPRWAQGTKFEFLQKRVPDYHKVEGNKLQTKVFYDRLARLFVIMFDKYALSGEPPEGIEDVDESVLDEPSTYVDETEEERKEREATYAEVRKRVVSFFQTNQRKLSKAKKTNEANESFEQLIRQLVKQPRREQAVHVYSKLHWEATLKAKFHVQWAKEIAEAGRQGKEMPVELEVRNRVIRGCWKKEEDSTRAAVIAAVESRYQAAVEDYKKTFIDTPLTDEDKEWAVSSAYMFLQPIVNMVAQRFGVVASLLMAGPVPSKGGQIDVLSVHAGRTRGLVPEIWPRYDRAGFKSAASSLSGFAHVVYGADTRAADPASVGTSHDTAGAANNDIPDFNDFNPAEFDDDDNNLDTTAEDVRASGGAGCSAGGDHVGREEDNDLMDVDFEEDLRRIFHPDPVDFTTPASTSASSSVSASSAPAMSAPATSTSASSATSASASSATSAPTTSTSASSATSAPTTSTSASSATSTSASSTSASFSSASSASSTSTSATSTSASYASSTFTSAASSASTTSTSPSSAPTTSTSTSSASVTSVSPSSAPATFASASSGFSSSAPATSTPASSPASPTSTAPTRSAPAEDVSSARRTAPIPARRLADKGPRLAQGGNGKSLGSTQAPLAIIEQQDGSTPPASTRARDTVQHQRPVLKPASWPPYFRKVHGELQSFKLGEDWEALIRLFFEFEQSHGFKGKHLACDLRPHEVSLWIKNARIWNRVSIVNHKNFAGRWWRWWESLQPGSRVFGDDLPARTAPSADMNWSKVDVAGMNGLLSVVAGLAMWGLEVVVSYADMEPWLDAVRDVCKVLRVVEEARQRGSAAKDSAAKSSSKAKARMSTKGRAAPEEEVKESLILTPPTLSASYPPL
ncbi:hypothetical protein BV25DRAFT_1921414 [Artomyces pyxidatus]|uniref:Uncharacterized protein n=1 Tax=Artomyces pyxidatus TaxID=48021 RepID=A0ACB8SJ23_9AGAM|nr:hypothetical protein BV25DRAFT_1921414 [Artomyces pyxidatus]